MENNQQKKSFLMSVFAVKSFTMGNHVLKAVYREVVIFSQKTHHNAKGTLLNFRFIIIPGLPVQDGLTLEHFQNKLKHIYDIL